jgi:hypothetical protein
VSYIERIKVSRSVPPQRAAQSGGWLLRSKFAVISDVPGCPRQAVGPTSQLPPSPSSRQAEDSRPSRLNPEADKTPRSDRRLDTVAEVLKLAERCVVEIRPRCDRASKLRERFSVAAPSVEAAYAYAVGLLVDGKKRWARSVRRCEWQDCRKFLFAKGNSGRRRRRTHV